MAEHFPIAHFLAVAKHGGVSKAARALGVAQPAVTKSIQRLEQRYGAALFERLPRGMQLTPVGQALARHAQLIDIEYRNAEAEISAIVGTHRGTINIGAGPTWLRNYLPQAVARLHASRPNVSVRIHSGSYDSLSPKLQDGDIDILLSALRLHEFQADDLITHEILVEDILVLIARKQHPLARLEKIPPEALMEYPWAVSIYDAQNREVLETLFRRNGLPTPMPAVESFSIGFVLSVLREGNYLSFQASHHLASPEAKGIVPLKFPSFSWQRVAGVSFRNTGTRPPAANLLLRELKAVLALEKKLVVNRDRQ